MHDFFKNIRIIKKKSLVTTFYTEKSFKIISFVSYNKSNQNQFHHDFPGKSNFAGVAKYLSAWENDEQAKTCRANFQALVTINIASLL